VSGRGISVRYKCAELWVGGGRESYMGKGRKGRERWVEYRAHVLVNLRTLEERVRVHEGAAVGLGGWVGGSSVKRSGWGA
jgi:hypothetical protein